MATEPRLFDPNYYYHIYNRGVEKRNIFTSGRDYEQFLGTLRFYLNDQRIPYSYYLRLNDEAKEIYDRNNPTGLKVPRVGIISYCLMPNHFHLVLKLNQDNGITRFLSDISNSYTRYFNTKNERVGRLFQGPFKSKEVRSEESLLQLTRYIHINPITSPKANPNNTLKPEDYLFSSYKEWVNASQSQSNPSGLRDLQILDRKELSMFIKLAGGKEAYKEFVEAKIGTDPSLGIEDLILE